MFFHRNYGNNARAWFLTEVIDLSDDLKDSSITSEGVINKLSTSTNMLDIEFSHDVSDAEPREVSANLDKDGKDTSALGADVLNADDEDLSTSHKSGIRVFLSFFRGISIFGLISAIFYLVMSIIMIYQFKHTEYALDMRDGALPVFLIFLSSCLANMGIFVFPVSILFNIMAKRFKTKLIAIFNAVVFACASILLACSLML